MGGQAAFHLNRRRKGCRRFGLVKRWDGGVDGRLSRRDSGLGRRDDGINTCGGMRLRRRLRPGLSRVGRPCTGRRRGARGLVHNGMICRMVALARCGTGEGRHDVRCGRPRCIDDETGRSVIET